MGEYCIVPVVLIIHSREKGYCNYDVYSLNIKSGDKSDKDRFEIFPEADKLICGRRHICFC